MNSVTGSGGTGGPCTVARPRMFEFSDLKPVNGLSLSNLTDEVYREYDFGDRVYRITNPVGLYMRPGGSTHRIVDDKGVTHCCPVPGSVGCVLRWKVKDGLHPCQF